MARISLPVVVAAGLLSVPLLRAQKPLGYADFKAEAKAEERFLAIPEAKLAGEHLKFLTAAPHLSGSPEDYKTAQYVAEKFRAAGLETEIVPYRVLLNRPVEEKLEAWDATGHLILQGLSHEHVEGDNAPQDARIPMPYHGGSASGDVRAEVVYANYGRPEDFAELGRHHIDVRGKVVLVRYGNNFRGVKAMQADLRGALALLIYSDPKDDGFSKGAVYPNGPWRPETAVQMGSVQYMFKIPGDPETPGVASTPSLPHSARTPVEKSGAQPGIPSLPLSYHDAEPILRALGGPVVRGEWQGGLDFPYHMGGNGVRVHLLSKQDYQLRTIWDVIGRLKGSDGTGEEVIVGNHRDAWVYGAVDPSSGTAAMLVTVHGIGALIHSGWRPRRSIVFCSWDAEEQGLVGSTEWVEQHMRELDHAVAYFNTDVAVSGAEFSASAVPSLRRFMAEVTQAVPSPLGSTVYQQWLASSHGNENELRDPHANAAANEVKVGNLGSGSDFSPFLQHAGVPSTDIGSDGPYGVYHSAFDNYQWFVQNADPHFVYLEEMARVLGIETLRMADADVLPFDYTAYAHDIGRALDALKRRAEDMPVEGLNFAGAEAGLHRFAVEAERVNQLVQDPKPGNARLNRALRMTETALLEPGGLPNRPWYKHTIFAPGEVTGYAVVLLPGVSEALDAHNPHLAAQQLEQLTLALDRAATTLSLAR